MLLFTGAFSGPPAAADPAAEASLQALFAREWDRRMADNPTWASALGDKRFNRAWPDLSPASIAAQQSANRAWLAELQAIPRSALSESDRLNYDLFERELRDRIAAEPFKPWVYAINMRDGIQTENLLLESLSFTTPSDWDDWLARLAAFGVYMDQTMALLEEGAREGRTQPRVIIQRIPEQVRQQIVGDPESSPYYAPYRAMPESIPALEQARLRQAARDAITGVVVPAYRRFETFLLERYLPASRDSVGISETPDGPSWYANRAAHFTTTAMTPDEIHQLGLAEVARIRGEMDAVIRQIGFKGSFPEFLAHLRSAPEFRYQSADDLLEAYRAMSKRIDPLLTGLFGKLPRTPYGVRPIPAISAPDTTTAYYMQPSRDGLRPGWFYVNLYRPEERPKYEIPVLTVHEAVPGHHLQIALAQELPDVPNFRRFGGFTAFVEGWGLYSESLGDEMGLYEDPYDRFGYLTYEMWRAVRLVVDTGMHSKGWTRDEAIEYFKANAGKTELDIVNEIDRYIGWPGQALAYKIGQLKIRELRSRAEAALGNRFDVRAFHDLVLGAGALPLDLLETRVDAWIAAQPAGG
jgi:prolyl oligopeptidase